MGHNRLSVYADDILIVSKDGREHLQRNILEAREFTILTDQKPLAFAFQQQNENFSSTQLRQLDIIVADISLSSSGKLESHS